MYRVVTIDIDPPTILLPVCCTLVKWLGDNAHDSVFIFIVLLVYLRYMWRARKGETHSIKHSYHVYIIIIHIHVHRYTSMPI